MLRVKKYEWGSFMLAITIFVVFLSKGNAGRSTIVTCKNILDDIFLENSIFSVKENPAKLIYFTFVDCPLPETSYFNFISNILHKNTTMDMLVLINIPTSPTTESHLDPEHLRYLNLSGFAIKYTNTSYIGRRLLRIRPGFLDSLSDLEYFYGNGIIMKSLPQNNSLTTVRLKYGGHYGKFGGCDKLGTLYLDTWKIGVDVKYWLSSCKLDNLYRLELVKITDESVYNGLVSRTKRLEMLTMKGSNLQFLPFFLINNTMEYLDILDLSDNQLISLNFADISYEYVLYQLTQLGRALPRLKIIIDHDGHIAWFLHQVPNLRHLILSGNKHFNFCSQGVINVINAGYNIEHRRLQKLLLNDTATTNLCIRKEAFPALEYMSLAGNTKVIKDLLISQQKLEVDFASPYYTIEEIEFTKQDYDYIKLNKIHGNVITLSGRMQLDCDCKHGFFAKALKDELVIAPLANCNKNNVTEVTPLKMLGSEYVECDKFVCGDSSDAVSSVCDCQRYWGNNSVHVDCRGRKVNKLPHVLNVYRIDAPYNRIEKLAPKDLSATVMFFDLTGNRIRHVDDGQSYMLFSIPGRRMKLSGNPIACDCENRAFIIAMQEHYQQIEDYDNLTCFGGDDLINDVVTRELCLNEDEGNKVLTLSLVMSSLLAMSALIGILYYRHRKMIRIILNARSWCLCCIKNKDLDRRYDVFVSFCHKDEILISEQLVPQLEELGYRICVHYRDWTPAELILTQLVESIETSARTIVVLSRSFLESMWGMLEFRTAHVSSLRDGIARLIVVVIDDVINDDNLAEDLRFYIRTNTYLKWDDPWFWDKLKYALPLVRNTPVTTDGGA